MKVPVRWNTGSNTKPNDPKITRINISLWKLCLGKNSLSTTVAPIVGGTMHLHIEEDVIFHPYYHFGALYIEIL